jgi:hypothetical protein
MINRSKEVQSMAKPQTKTHHLSHKTVNEFLERNV